MERSRPGRRSSWAGELAAGGRCRRPRLPPALQQQAIERLAERLGADLALDDTGLAPLASRRTTAAPASPRPGRLALLCPGGRHGASASGRPHSGRRRADAASPSCLRPHAVSRRHRAAGGGLRLSGRARADPPARAPADRGRDPGSRRPQGAREGGGARRGRPARGELQPRRHAHRGAGERPSHAVVERLARAAHAAVPYPSRDRVVPREGRRQVQGRARTRYRGARPADRRDPAGEPARLRPGRCRRANRSICSRSSSRKAHATT